MQVFISWSGDLSRSVAEALDKTIRHVVRGASTFISTQDIDPGQRWETRVSEELQNANHAVLCITRDNQTAPWLNYEAGALGKLLGTSKVIPYTIGFPPSELKSGPLTRFQGVQNDESGTWSLMRSLNRSSASPDDDGFLREDFDLWFPRLRDAMIEANDQAARSVVGPNERELLLEIRQDIRRLFQLNRCRASDGVHQAIGLLEQALRDTLTRLPNRASFSARTAELAASSTPYVIAYLDLDGFKTINDVFGHQRGDEVLVAVAAVLKEKMPTADLVARLGGDEFAAIFRGQTPEAVAKVLEDVVMSLPKAVEATGHPPVAASCGVSSDRIEDSTLKLREADNAMYRAKQEGRARVVLSE